MKQETLTIRQERYAQNVFLGMEQAEAYRLAGYKTDKMALNTLYADSSRLASSAKVKQRLTQLRQAAEDATVATVLERKQVLTEIVRGRFIDFMTKLTPEKLRSAALQEIRITEIGKEIPVKSTTIRLHSSIQAIAELNKMEKLYAEGPTVNIDNRKVEILVVSDTAREATRRITEGERTE